MRTKVKADGDTIAAQLNVARGTLRKGITALGIAGNAYTHLVPRDKLQMGDAAIIASLMQGDHEVLRISMIIIKRNHSVLLQGHYWEVAGSTKFCYVNQRSRETNQKLDKCYRG
jgi:hypothetical protein